ncbi:MAG: hypothetical protein M1837_006142 [Sclerophora amabilis]|nr:MAG: hypothetical protein M1837_006142 [Sclerophora amabilis]
MVSTRSHPSNFPPPTLSPSKPSRNSSTPSTRRQNPKDKLGASTPWTWTHTPSNLALIWLLISVPLVTWDTMSVFLRPHSVPGGWLLRPLWSLYALYGEADQTQGFVGWNANEGFTEALSALNVLETGMYAWYLWVVLRPGRAGETEDEKQTKGKGGRGAPSPSKVGWFGRPRSVGGGKEVQIAVLVGFAAAVMTVSKTMCYWLREYYSARAAMRDSSAFSILLLFVIPKGALLIFPSYLIYVFGAEILQALEIASNSSSSGWAIPSTRLSGNIIKAITAAAGGDRNDDNENEKDESSEGESESESDYERSKKKQ